MDIEQHKPSGLVLTSDGCQDLQESSGGWYDDEVTRQGKRALTDHLRQLGVNGEKAAMSFLEMTRAQVQTLIGNKGRPTRENLEAALRRTGTSLNGVINESRKRELMIKKSGEHFRRARKQRNEPQSSQRFSPSDCDRVVRAEGLPPYRSFFEADDWAPLIQGIQNTHDLNLFESVASADWAFGRLILDGFRVQMMTAISEFGDIDNVDLHEPPDYPQSKIGVILRLYSGFKGAPNRVEVARRTGLRKSACDKVITELIDYSGLEPGDFEPTVSSLPLLLLKSEGTSGYVSECLRKMSSRRGGD